ncbi:hypothetical protein MTR67_035710 [Solanum verrucosum]|uniref:Uncharacterized protein n=1 Tax=Solanum verrucosum TaxID=315347 RepID=A0AAF0UA77_SOLVR|nr:hypothetical protein MTR67_035710 [Solanum verrucosum]
MSTCLEDYIPSFWPNLSNAETQGVNLPMRSNTEVRHGVSFLRFLFFINLGIPFGGLQSDRRDLCNWDSHFLLQILECYVTKFLLQWV